MSFLRRFCEEDIKKLTFGKNGELFGLLKSDVSAGEVFPAVRADGLCFYYKGGCLYKFSGGVFSRDEKYNNYSRGQIFADDYQRAKAEVVARFTNSLGGAAERRFLDALYRHTYCVKDRSDVIVLDIEVNLGGRAVRKCDLLLYNTLSGQLMFAEGKIFSDRRVKCSAGHIPEVIEQVRLYSEAVAAQKQTILEMYGQYVLIVNKLFGTDFRHPKEIIQPVKLLVYKAGAGKPENVSYTVDIIERNLGKGNVLWTAGEPSLNEIWDRLC